MQKKGGNIILLYIPWLLSTIYSGDANTSFGIAWLGQFFIIYYSLTSLSKEENIKLRDRVMTPIIINQIIFFGFSGLTSIFYFMDMSGYYFLEKDIFYIPDAELLIKTSDAQRLYVLGHAGMVTGILSYRKEKKKDEWRVVTGNSISLFILIISAFSFIVFIALKFVPGLEQVAIMFETLNLVSSILALSMALREKNILVLVIASFLFVSNISAALLSGWKEQILIPFILLGFFLYQYFPKSVMIGMPIIIYIYFVYVPTFNNIYRNLTWNQGQDQNIAYEIALASTLNADNEEVKINNWSFLTSRLSEINMLIKYMESTPENKSYYYFEIIQQSILNLVPRILYPEKPITETLVMQRVYNAGVVSDLSNVSAKPAFISDCYLSGGSFGVLTITFMLGYFMQFASGYCEKLFGNYTFGTALMYNSFFNELWRGNCFEFIATSIFWGTIMVYVIHRLARYGKIIKPIE
jgi:hypothetical protein